MAGIKVTAPSRWRLPIELTSFVGRRQLLADTRQLLSSSRLLTLTGVGGVGKTRLAMRMIAEVRRTFPDGVWFVELAALQDPDLLAYTVAEGLGLREVSANPTADLAEYLSDKHALLVLDNCEHLSVACAVLTSKLLAAAPGLRVLATSRHRLGIEGEQIRPVPPLSLPRADVGVSAGNATHFEAVALFADRAKAVLPTFEIVDANRAVLIELCRRLEGIPLAIELAAVWVRTLSLRQILDRLENRFRLLSTGNVAAPPRQQALEAAIDWSFNLCSPREQLLWTRLSVFSGGFDLDAVEDVCSGDGLERDEILGLVAGLVDKSIITRQDDTYGERAWYQMLETIRQYGLTHLADPVQRRALQIRHRDYYRSLANRYEAEIFGPSQADWFIRLRRELGNLRFALDFCLAEPGEVPAALEIATPIWNFWVTGFLREGHEWLLRALELAPESTHLRAKALWAASYLAMLAGEADQTRNMLAECRVLADQFYDPYLQAQIAECAGHAALYQGDLPGAMALLEEALAGYRAAGCQLGEFDTLLLLAAASFFLGDPRVEEYSQAALALADGRGAQSSKAYALWGVGIVQWRAGDYRQSVSSNREGIRLGLPLNDTTSIAFCVQSLSWCASSDAPDERAARLLGASRAVWRSSGAKVDETSPYGQFDEESKERVRQAIGQEAFDAAYNEGAELGFEQAVALALGDGREPKVAEVPESRISAAGVLPTSAVSPPSVDTLTRREREIAELVGQGQTNKEIAARLVIAQRTAETHVEHILTKLGFTSRTQIAGWLADHRPRG